MTKYRAEFLIVLFVAFEAVSFLIIDRPVSDFMRDLDSSNPAVIDFFRAITDYAKSKWYLWPSGIGVLLCAALLHLNIASTNRRQQIATAGQNLLFFFASVAVSGLLTDAIKPILGRARPVEMLRDHAYGFQPFTFDAAWNSMPSGHATSAIAVATALYLLFPRARLLWFVLGFTLALSRVMVNAHYLSDVVAGSVIGCLTAFAFWRLRSHQGMFHPMEGIFPIDKQAPEA